MPGPKLNESPVIRRRSNSRAQAVQDTPSSARAVARFVRVSPYKVRQVLDLIRGHEVQRAQDLLTLCDRDAATLVGKVLASAMANAEHNHTIEPDELYVSACFADEGPTLKRWRPRARGRATPIRKRTSHITVIVSRLPDDELRQRRAERAQAVTGRRARRQRPSGASRPTSTGPATATTPAIEPTLDETSAAEVPVDGAVADEAVVAEAVVADPEVDPDVEPADDAVAAEAATDAVATDAVATDDSASAEPVPAEAADDATPTHDQEQK